MVDWFQKLNSQTDFSTINIEETAKSLGIVEDSAIKFATAVKNGSVQLEEGQTMLQGYQASFF